MMEQKWGLEREDKKEKSGDEEEGSENGPGKSQEEEILSSASCQNSSFVFSLNF